MNIPWASKNYNTYRLGSSGKGKTTSILNQVEFHVEQGDGVAVFDPHNNLLESLLNSPVLEKHYKRVVYFDPADDEFVLDYNPFSASSEKDAGRLTADFLNSLKTLFAESWGYRLSHILMICLYALFMLGENLASLTVLLSKTDKGKELRSKVIAKCANAEVKRFFKSEFYSYPQEAFLPVLNKVSGLLLEEKIRRVLSRKKNSIDARQIMDEGKIFLANLTSSVLGAEISSALGAMLIAQFQKAAFQRSDVPEKDRKPFHIFVDEAYRFNAAGVYESIINEGRKFRLFLNVSHQDFGQIDSDTLKTFLSIQNLMVFGVNIEDAKLLSRVFDNKVRPEEFAGLGRGEVYARIENEIAKFKTFPPDENNVSTEGKKKIISHSRKLYYTKLSELEKRPKKKPRIYDSF